MKKLIIICLLLTSVSLVASAQNAKTNSATSAAQVNPGVSQHEPSATELNVAKQKAESNTKMLVTKLGLTKEQNKAVYDVEYRYYSYCSRYPANAPQSTLSNITSERNNKLKGILTPEQFEKYQTLQSK